MIVVVTLSLGIVLWLAVGAFFKGAESDAFGAVFAVVAVVGIIAGFVYAIKFFGFGWGMYFLWFGIAAFIGMCMTYNKLTFKIWAWNTLFFHGFFCIIHALGLLCGLFNGEVHPGALIASCISVGISVFMAYSKWGKETSDRINPFPEFHEPTLEERQRAYEMVEELKYPPYYREKFRQQREEKKRLEKERAERDKRIEEWLKQPLGTPMGPYILPQLYENQPQQDAQPKDQPTDQPKDQPKDQPGPQPEASPEVSQSEQPAEQPGDQPGQASRLGERRCMTIPAKRKYWYLIDDTATFDRSMHNQIIFVDDKEDAVAEGQKVWDAMSQEEKDKRDEFFVCYAPEDSTGSPNLRQATHYHYFKSYDFNND